MGFFYLSPSAIKAYLYIYQGWYDSLVYFGSLVEI